MIHVGPEEWHFHGGSPDAPLIPVAGNGGAPEWEARLGNADHEEGF